MNVPVLSRRALLGSTVAIGAVGLPAVALAGLPDVAAPDADAALFAIIERHAEAEATWEAACRDLEAAQDRAWAAYPPRPAALTATSADVILHGLAPSGRSRTPGGQAWIYLTLDDFDRLRAVGLVTSFVLDDTGGSVVIVPNPAGEARRREIVDTYDRWLSERAAVDDRLGLTAAEAAEEPLRVVMEEAETAVEAYVPMTFGGVVAKARWALARCDRDDAVLALVRQLAGDSAPSIGDEDADGLQAAA